MAKNNNERIREGEVLEVHLSGIDKIPRARDLADMLLEWHTWYHTYYTLIHNVGKTADLYDRTTDALKKWGRIDA